MPKTLGFEYSVRWGNPFTEPPLGMDRVLVRGFSETNQPPAAVLEVKQKMGFGSGWALCCQPVEAEPRRLSQEAKGKIRRRRMEKRMRQRHPLFADIFIAEELERRPGYFAGEDVAYVPPASRELRRRLETLTAPTVDAELQRQQEVTNA